MKTYVSLLSLGVLVAIQMGCNTLPAVDNSKYPIAPQDNRPSLIEEQSVLERAQAFLKSAEEELFALSVESNKAQWAYETNITPETEKAAADISATMSAAMTRLAQAAAKVQRDGLPADILRKLDKLRLSATMATPADEKLNNELAEISTNLNGMYGAAKGKYKGEDKDLDALSSIVGDASASPADRLEAWRAWHDTSAVMKDKYARMVNLANQGAQELNFKDTGAMWRSKYDMAADDFAKELDRLWTQVRPLYDDLHCYVRGTLNQKYGDAVVSKTGPMPAHMLGNMWAQAWSNVYSDVKPAEGDFPQAIDVTARLKEKGYDDKKMVTTAEGFFASLGMRMLPESFWTNSMFQKPEGKEAVCHASAWDVDNRDDVRIKMCISVDDDNFKTIHHELGHNYYQMAYQNQPYLFLDSANDGFHEAVGDTIALSITPKYLKQIGLVDDDSASDKDNIPYLMQMALDKVAFLPFGLLVDQWRWKVFSGETAEKDYNKSWWDLRLKYQGIAPAVERSDDLFDAGAKYHVAASVPYSRYFLAAILQFQFYRSMCESAGHEGPLYTCSFFGSKEAGQKMMAMLEMGASKPWQDALEAMVGTREMDARAILDYFAPLQTWLKAKNTAHNYQCGW